MLPLEIKRKLASIGQLHLLNYWNELTPDHKNQLISQIESLDLQTLTQQKSLLKSKSDLSAFITPIKDYAFVTGNSSLGRKLLSQNKCGCLLIAGGQGSRLRYPGPKGLVPVSVVKHKTLFQLFAEKTLAAGTQAGCPLPLAIMTSPLNHDLIVSYFTSQKFFGLQPDQIFFYPQTTLPFLNDQGDLFLEDIFTIAVGPDGNGSALKSFVEAGIWDAWHKSGIEYVNFILVDNPLADPFDAELLSFHAAQEADVTVKSVLRLNEDEKVGILAEQEGHLAVVEYTEISETESTARLPSGELKYPCANLSLFCLSMDFIRHPAYRNYSKMPLHKALKAVKYLDEQGISKMSEKPQAWKFERFIFDILPLAEKVKILVYPREICFAPLKNATGPDSLETVQTALQLFDKQAFEKMTRQPAPKEPFELSQEFHYPTPELLKKWQGRPASDSNYISP